MPPYIPFSANMSENDDELDDVVSTCMDKIAESSNDATIIDQLAADLSFQEKLQTVGQTFLNETHSKIKSHGHKMIQHKLPIARIKKIMKQDACTNPRKIGSDASPTMALACQLIVGLITKRMWTFASAHGRTTIQLKDVINSLETSDKFDFLIDLVEKAHTQSMSKKSRTSGWALSELEGELDSQVSSLSSDQSD
ncbi:MAG: hypothetical protein SGPRY_006480 [Prymnesium sp.]